MMLLCAGEALIDMLLRQSTEGEAAFAPYPGGSVFNTAIAASRLGLPTRFFTGLSNDLFGDRLSGALTANGVDASLAARSDRPTTLAFVTLTDGQAEYAFYDEESAGRMLSEADLPDIPADVSAVFFGGISLAVEPCADAYATLAERAHKAGKLVMLDPNIRPGFIGDEAVYRARLARMIGYADAIKFSDEDLAWWLGRGDIAAQAHSILDQGPSFVAVTAGGDGVTGYTSAGALHVPAETVTVVDTVGAGDTFNGGFLAGLHDAGAMSRAGLQGLDADGLKTALSLGMKAAAITVSRAGANPPRREDLA